MPFEEILGLPAHPLLVHAAVVLVPLLIVVGIGYGLIPPLRRKLDVVLVALALAAPGAVFAARESGAEFEKRLASKDQLPAELAEKVANHSALSETLWWLVLALGGLALLLVLADKLLSPRTTVYDEDGDEMRTGGVFRFLVTLLLTLALLGVGAGAGWYVYRTGHTGSQMVWEGS
ncbi:MAG: DUF2231 domain-containing protein [Micromonosporaceae bacterium]